MTDNMAVEKKMRTFLADDLMKEQAAFLTMQDELDLDSLDLTELRVFLNEEFGIEAEFDQVPPEALNTLGNIMLLVAQKSAQSSALAQQH